jgi:subtilisin family serine protease
MGMDRGSYLLALTLVAGLLLLASGVAGSQTASGAPANQKMIGINVVLKSAVTQTELADLGRYGKVRDVIPELKAVTLQAPASALATIQARPYVATANPDARRQGGPVDTVAEEDFADGANTWNLDAVNVTDFGKDERPVAYDGNGVYVAVLDTGLLDSWRQYFPEERIDVARARAFGGGGGEVGTVSQQPQKWQHDQNSHGTHVTSTVLGYSFGAGFAPVNGVAPKATVIPVKVLSQEGFGWSSVIARGIVYVADLKAGPLADTPVVINMSLGGSQLDAIEKAAIDYAISKGVIIVASAGNEGESGMGYPGAYQPVISSAASGWTGEWIGPGWIRNDVADPTKAEDFYITDFSGRQKAGQDLDVAAPGSWVVGPYQEQSGKTSYFYLNGTSMAAPHVAGIVGLMAQKSATLTAAQAEGILERTAIPFPAGCRTVAQAPWLGGTSQQVCWGADATGAGLATADAALAETP